MSLNQFSEGTQRAIAEVVTGIALAAFLGVMTAIPQIPELYRFIFGLIGVVPAITLILEMRTWNVVYTLGWALGIGMMIYSGILSPLSIALYIGIPATFWGIRGFIYLRDNGHI